MPVLSPITANRSGPPPAAGAAVQGIGPLASPAMSGLKPLSAANAAAGSSAPPARPRMKRERETIMVGPPPIWAFRTPADDSPQPGGAELKKRSASLEGGRPPLEESGDALVEILGLRAGDEAVMLGLKLLLPAPLERPAHQPPR